MVCYQHLCCWHENAFFFHSATLIPHIQMWSHAVSFLLTNIHTNIHINQPPHTNVVACSIFFTPGAAFLPNAFDLIFTLPNLHWSHIYMVTYTNCIKMLNEMLKSAQLLLVLSALAVISHHFLDRPSNGNVTLAFSKALFSQNLKNCLKIQITN